MIDYLEVRTTGGAISQLLGLSNGVYLKGKNNRAFKIRHYLFGVGTYYPFALRKLLNNDEVLDLNFVHRGYQVNESITSGMLVENGPLQRMSFEKIYTPLRGTKLDSLIRWNIFRHKTLNGTIERLNSVSQKTKVISGNYVPLVDSYVIEDIKKRFEVMNKYSPFAIPKNVNYDVLIHYRIGDIRLKYSIPTTKGDGIIHPKYFARQIATIFKKKRVSVGVVSDSPKEAVRLLGEVGIDAKLANSENNLWLDLQHMIHAKMFIGSHSQVSAFAATIREHNSLESYLPLYDSEGRVSIWKSPNSFSFDAHYLGKSDAIFNKQVNFENNPVYKIYEEREY